MEEDLDIKTRLVINSALTEMKMRALMMIVEKLVARYIERYNLDLTVLDEGNLRLFEFARRFYFAEEEEAFQRILVDLSEFTLSEL